MKTSEEKVLIKEEILEQCLSKQQSLIDDFKLRIEEIKQLQKLEQDSNGTGTIKTSISELNFVGEALDFAKEEMRTLYFLKSNLERPHETPELGAVVVTDKVTFFVSVSVEKFMAGGKHYFGISTQSPVFKAMRGKFAFETFKSGDTSYLIKEIY